MISQTGPRDRYIVQIRHADGLWRDASTIDGSLAIFASLEFANEFVEFITAENIHAYTAESSVRIVKYEGEVIR